MSANRVIYDYSPFYGKLSQGSIINGCVAEAFSNEEVFGLIITPRCDLSHNGKVSTVHYVPVIPFEIWFGKIAKPIIKEQWKKELANNLDIKFKNAKIGANVMEAEFTYDELCKIIDHKVIKSQDKKDMRDLMDAYFDKDEDAFDYYLLEGDTQKKKNHKMLELLSRLHGNSIHSYYLIEGWKDYGEDKHLVVMLRDVRRIEYEIAHKIGNGVEESVLGLTDTIHNDLFLTPAKSNFYFVQALIASPFIEHIMEAFTYNFSRIGVEDRAVNTLELLSESAKKTIK